MAKLFRNPSAASGPGRTLDELAAARGIAIGIACGGTLWALVGWTLWRVVGPG